MWQNHFKSLLNSSKDVQNRDFVISKINDVSTSNTYFERFSVEEVRDSFKNIKCNKTCGVDGIYGEHLKYAHSKLHVLLSLLFNIIIIHGHIPIGLMDTLLVPLVKDKNGVLSDKDNYRPLAITCIISKVLEVLILNRFKDYFKTSDNQFGFKESLSTDMCIFTLKQVCDYYVKNGSPVYICFLDASKAFDKINHWTLFRKLFDRNIPAIIVRILYVWYSSQQFYVKWNGNLSEPFLVSNGVRQGGILSPYLFNLYIDDLSIMLSRLPTGCMFNGVRMNHLFYADDSVLLSPSPHSMQMMLNVCEKFANDHELQFNTKKTFCLCIKPKWLKNLITPTMYLCGSAISFSKEHKYLGMKLCDDRTDDADMKRQLRCIYARGNALVKRFSHCSEDVRIKLFKSYCSSFYCLNLWCRFNVTSLKKVRSSYNKMFRKFLCVTKENMTCFMVEKGIKTFNEIERHLIYSFRKRLLNCDTNVMISTICDSLFYLTSPIITYWNKRLFI